MGAEPVRFEAQGRGARMLRTALGGAIAEWLADPAVIEIMLNPDGRLWVDRLGAGITDSGILLAATDGELRHQVNEDVRDSDAATNRCKNVLCLRGEPGYPIGEEVSRCKYQG